MSKIIVEKEENTVKFAFPDDAKITTSEKTIRISNYPPPKTIGKIKYLGGTVIGDREFIQKSKVIEEVDGVPADIKTKAYTYDEDDKTFAEVTKPTDTKEP